MFNFTDYQQYSSGITKFQLTLLDMKKSEDSVDGRHGKTNVILSVTSVTTFTVSTCD